MTVPSALIPIVVFYVIYKIIKEILDFFLKRRIINTGHLDKAEILGDTSSFAENTEMQKYPSLKWGLLFFFAGVGAIISSYFYFYTETSDVTLNYNSFFREMISLGIMLTSISLGFLIYFFIVMKSKK